MRALLISAILLAGSLGHASYSVRCWGYTSQTREYVDGFCNNGSFSGYTSQTRAWVNGFCQEGGSLSGTVSTTREWVHGQCDHDPFGSLESLDEAN